MTNKPGLNLLTEKIGRTICSYMEMLSQPFNSRDYRAWEEIISFQLNGILEDEGLHAFNVALAFWEKHMGGPPPRSVPLMVKYYEKAGTPQSIKHKSKNSKCKKRTTNNYITRRCRYKSLFDFRFNRVCGSTKTKTSDQSVDNRML